MAEKETQTDDLLGTKDLEVVQITLNKKGAIISLKIIEFFYLLRKGVLNNLMTILIIIAACLGIGLSFILRGYAILTSDQKLYFALPGELFMRALRFVSLPLIVCNLITGISGLTHKSRLIALRALIFYSVSLLSSLALGFLIALTVQPGSRVSVNTDDLQQFNSDSLETPVSISDTILDIFRNLIPGLYREFVILRDI